MTFLLLLPTVLSFLLLAAHFLRAGEVFLMVLALLLPLVLIVQHRATLWIVQLMLLVAAAEWVRTLLAFMAMRAQMQRPHTPGSIILGAVVGFTLLAALLLLSRRVRRAYPLASGT